MPEATFPSLRDKRVVATGGSGVRAGVVEAFVKQAARVFFLDGAEADSRQLVESLSGSTHTPVSHRCDLTDVAATAPFLASEQARMCTGHESWIDAGWR